ncbi:hypothetical protein DAI22_02g027401 [Oryza sativa Japonica Group]|nr:hypothetical protein DAI22_02g027401 [Oryza sativa Japonica Group]
MLLYVLGIVAMSWCPHNPNLLLACTKNNKILVWNKKTNKVISEATAARCLYAQWSRTTPGQLAVIQEGKLRLCKLDGADVAE